MSDDFERDRLAQELRASLARHAAEAPRGDALAERIIHAADQNAADARESQRRGWRAWALPAVAAAAVAGVVLAVVGIENYHPHHAAIGSTTSVTPTVSVDQSTLASPNPTHTTTRPVKQADLTDVKIIDLTFAEGQGWALGTADCKSGPGRCTALLTTKDGTTWTSMGGEVFDVPGVSTGCAQTSDTCVSDIRFADNKIGYAFGPSAFFMTTDGGAHWMQEPGGALALETFHGSAIRVFAASPSGCPGPCGIQVETAPNGSPNWTPAPLGPSTVNAAGDVQLSRTAGYAYLLITGNPAGGASRATSTLYRSTDDGKSWVTAGEPCPSTGPEVDSHAVTAGSGERVSVLCATRQAPQHWFVATSTDAGARFSATPGTVPAAIAPTLLTGDPATVLVAAGNGMARSTDGGVTWHRIRGVTGTVSFVGFESTTEGRAVTDGNTIWTTTDAGKHWTPAPFG